MKAKEIYKQISYTNIEDLKDQLTNMILTVEPELTKKQILADIDSRNKLGEGLLAPTILSMHVIDDLVKVDAVFYVTLNKEMKYFSKVLDQSFNIKKLVMIVVNPKHKLDQLSNLKEFIGS